MDRARLDKIKIVFTDLDGTLISSERELEQKSVEVLKALKAKGITTIVATGRSYESASPFISKLFPEGPSICFNGAVIYADHGKKKLHEFLLDDDMARTILEYGREYDLHTLGFQQGQLLYETHSEDGDRFQSHGGLTAELADFDRMEHLGFSKMMYVSDDRESILKAADRLEDLYGKRLSHYFSIPYFYEFVNGNVGKDKAAAVLLKDLGLRSEQAMAFGDAHNDVGMLEFVGIGVAMANSEPEVKEAADTEALSNDDLGVARFLDNAFGLGVF